MPKERLCRGRRRGCESVDRVSVEERRKRKGLERSMVGGGDGVHAEEDSDRALLLIGVGVQDEVVANVAQPCRGKIIKLRL